MKAADRKKERVFQRNVPRRPAAGRVPIHRRAENDPAIANVTSKDKHPVYILQGHQEIPLAQLATLKSELEGENYVVKELNLLKEGKIPDDAQMLLLLGPQNDLNDKEAELITQYVKGRGKLYMGSDSIRI